ncbi:MULTISPECIES: S8 family peptidase [unclassified Streptomyces]|uniref:S8 family peptidase n=1 Tax=unclassified Streptomyces TaxID=2593676 RepID=UPI0036E79205
MSRWRFAPLAGACTALLLTVLASPADAAEPAPLGVIRGADSPGAIDGSYIVVLEQDAPSARSVKARELTTEFGGSVRRTFSTALNGFTLEATAAQARRIAADPSVAFVEQNGVEHADATQYSPTWGLDRVDQANLPLSGSYTYSTTASNVTAYIIDTGIRITHGDFGGRASYGYDFVDNDSVASDCHGHGTHTAGTVGSGTYGVAKGVSLVAVRVLDCSGSGTTANVIAGYEWVAANAHRPAVANVSIGGTATDAKDAAVAGMVDAGVTVAVSAGNSSTSACNQSPAREPSVITVASTTSTDARSSFSNYGTCVDIFAPGSSITSLGYASDTATAVMSGTSMASPHVAGAAALYLATHPSASPAAVTAALKAKATSSVVTDAQTGSPNLLLNVTGL